MELFILFTAEPQNPRTPAHSTYSINIYEFCINVIQFIACLTARSIMLGRWVLRTCVSNKVMDGWMDGWTVQYEHHQLPWIDWCLCCRKIRWIRNHTSLVALGYWLSGSYRRVGRICGWDDSPHCSIYGTLTYPPWLGFHRSHMYMINFLSLNKASSGLSAGLPEETSIPQDHRGWEDEQASLMGLSVSPRAKVRIEDF